MRLLNTDGTISMETDKDVWIRLAEEKSKDFTINKYDLQIENLKILTQDAVSGAGH